MTLPRVAFFDAKPYDREYFDSLNGGRLHLDYYEFPVTKDVAPLAKGASAICAFVHDLLDRDNLLALHDCGIRMAAMRCAGFNAVDLDAARELGMTVTRVPAYSPSAVAEHAVALLLTLVRRTHRAYNRIRDHNFSLNGFVGFDLAGKTAGVIGCGKIGRKMAQILRGFEMRVLAFDPMMDMDWAAAHGIESVDLDAIWAESDVLSLHTPLLPATEYLVRAETIAKMKPGVVLINTSRGKLVETEELIAGLRSGRIGGVGLDVYEEEDQYFYADHSERIMDDETLAYLLTFPNALVTSHQAFLTREALTQIAETTIFNIAAKAAGVSFLPGTVLIDPEAG